MIDRAREMLARYRGYMIGAAAILLIFWIGFLDSHSLLKRYQWHREADALKRDNAALQEEIDRLEMELGKDLTDEEVERIAREQYGMQREGETVHPLIEGE
ncbi:MAG: septum formation initiator family protein [Rhodothermales bacterium]|nr:septum formation initiator family protein [Rhodothermales bacterium]